MTESDKQHYLALVAELRTLGKRLAEVADCAFGNMEGAGMPEFAIEEELTDLKRPALFLAKLVDRVEELLKEGGRHGRT